MKRVNLRSLFTRHDDPEVVDFIKAKNVIYCIENLLTNHKYIGQAKNLYDRFVGNTKWSHLVNYTEASKVGTNSHLYRAFIKYKSRNFDVTILESDVTDLNNRESYWISEFHTYHRDPEYSGGYNMTPGGDSTDHMHTKESIAARVETNKLNHGGVLNIHTTESLLKSRSTRESNGNGDCMYGCHTPEVVKSNLTDEMISRRVATNKLNHGGVLSILTPDSIEKAHNSLEIKYGSRVGLAATKESRIKSLDSNRKNHGGVLNIELPEVRALAIMNSHTDEANKKRSLTNSNLYGDTLPYHSEESQKKSKATHMMRYGKLMSGVHTKSGEFNQRLSCWFSFSSRYRSKCTDFPSYLQVCTRKHIKFLLENYCDLSTHYKWETFHDELYKFVLDNQD